MKLSLLSILSLTFFLSFAMEQPSIKKLWEIPTTTPVAASVYAQGNNLYAAEDTLLKKYNITSGEVLEEHDLEASILTLSYWKDSTYVLTNNPSMVQNDKVSKIIFYTLLNHTKEEYILKNAPLQSAHFYNSLIHSDNNNFIFTQNPFSSTTHNAYIGTYDLSQKSLKTYYKTPQDYLSCLLLDKQNDAHIFAAGELLYNAPDRKNSPIITLNLETGDIIQTFKGHSNWVNALIDIDKKLYSCGGNNNAIVAWDKISTQKIQTFGKALELGALEEYPHYLISTDEGIIHIWDIRTYQILTTHQLAEGQRSNYTPVSSTGFIICSGNPTNSNWKNLWKMEQYNVENN